MVSKLRCHEMTGGPRIKLTHFLLPSLLPLKYQLYRDLARCEEKMHSSPLQQVTLSNWLYLKKKISSLDISYGPLHFHRLSKEIWPLKGINRDDSYWILTMGTLSAKHVMCLITYDYLYFTDDETGAFRVNNGTKIRYLKTEKPRNRI